MNGDNVLDAATENLLDVIAKNIDNTDLTRKLINLAYHSGYQDGQINAIKAQLSVYDMEN